MLKNALLIVALIFATPCSIWADSYNQTITAIFGSGNPDTGWTTDSANGITLALRGKHRVTGSTTNTNGVYGPYTTGLVPPSNNRAFWNWEFSINSGAANLNANYDYYVGIDTDPSECIDYTVVDALLSWNDNSYGNDATQNGQGSEGPSAVLAPSNNIAQQSQNLVFVGGNPSLDATYNYELYAVAKGAGPGGAKLVSVAITVIVGTGGAVCTDSDGDGVEDDVDHCVPSVLGGQVDVGSGPTSIANDDVDENGCSIQDRVNECKADAKNHGHYVSCIAKLANDLRKSGAITNQQSTEMKNGAAKSQIGK
jgi:hypothetical protein